MIPQISQAPGIVQLVVNFLQELEQQGFTGDTATSYAERLTMSTDNSIYQLLPDAVVFPRSTADVALIARLAAQERYTSLIFTPRGGGTGTNGQALNQGIIVDMSRYMNRIIEINPEEVNDIFAVTEDSDKVVGQVSFKITAKRPIPFFGTPTL